MKVSAEAEVKIRRALRDNPGKLPRLVLRKGGCAGNILVLLLETPDASDSFVDINGIRFALAKNAVSFVDNVLIELKPGLCEEIAVKVADLSTCKCGKSFRLS